MQGKGRCVDGLSPVVKEVYTWALGVGNVNNGVEEGAKVYTIEIARNSILLEKSRGSVDGRTVVRRAAR